MAKSKLIRGDERPDDMALKTMRDRGGTWYAYQNMDMSHWDLGDLRFLQAGPEPGRTFKTPPERYPDTRYGLGWRYLLVGQVNLETGAIHPIEREV